MTDQQINESVARKLGWKPSYPHENGCQFCEETRGHHHEWGSFGQRSILEHIPDFCHSIAAAWEIVEFVRQKRKSTKGLFIRYGVTIQTRANSRKVRVYIFGRFGMADTAPMAICRAFLEMKGEK